MGVLEYGGFWISKCRIILLKNRQKNQNTTTAEFIIGKAKDQ